MHNIPWYHDQLVAIADTIRCLGAHQYLKTIGGLLHGTAHLDKAVQSASGGRLECKVQPSFLLVNFIAEAGQW